VTAELERRWEMALRELKRAEEEWEREQRQQPTLDTLDPETREALRAAGRQVAELWRAERFSQEPKKALLRCLMDKVVLHRSAPDEIACRVVWRGGDTTDASITVTVGSLKRRMRGQEMEQAILTLAGQGETDKEIARRLTLDGHRSPRHTTVLPSTVQYIRLRHRVFTNHRQSHPRRVAGYLTVPQVAEKLKIERDWIYHRIHTGTIEVARDPVRQLLSVSRHGRNHPPVPAARGGEGPAPAFLGGHQDAVSKTLDTFDFAAQPSINEALVRELMGGAYIENRENILVVGASGTGKTHLASALAFAACAQGRRVRFFTVTGLVTKLLEQREERSLERLHRQLERLDLVVLDELGYVPFSKSGAELLFEVVSRAYERSSVIVTTNLPFEEWTEVLGSERLTGATLDRLTHRCTIVETGSESYRLRESKRRQRRGPQGAARGR
jgi:DNA replication protein DnaC